MSDLDHLKTRVTEAVDRMAEELWSLALRIHANPELAFKEEKAAAWLTEFLERQGCRVERGVGGLPTAFRAEVPGTGDGPTIAVMAEYDALPGIGHACGHNVIATAGAGAGAALAVVAGSLAQARLPYGGRIAVVGTPAEEGGAGKVKLMDAGVFRNVDAAMLLARNGLGGEWHLAYHEFMQLHLQARVIYVDAYNMPQFVVIENDTL